MWSLNVDVLAEPITRQYTVTEGDSPVFQVSLTNAAGYDSVKYEGNGFSEKSISGDGVYEIPLYSAVTTPVENESMILWAIAVLNTQTGARKTVVHGEFCIRPRPVTTGNDHNALNGIQGNGVFHVTQEQAESAPAAFGSAAGTESTDYAAAGHDHTGVYAPETHNHDADYSAAGHDHTDVYASETHNHDADYSAAGHNHTGVYASETHNHDADYSAAGHNHTGVYAPASHNHDADYSAFGHNHTGVYASETHNHDADYSASGHNHGFSELTGTPALRNLLSGSSFAAPFTDTTLASVTIPVHVGLDGSWNPPPIDRVSGGDYSHIATLDRTQPLANQHAEMIDLLGAMGISVTNGQAFSIFSIVSGTYPQRAIQIGGAPIWYKTTLTMAGWFKCVNAGTGPVFLFGVEVDPAEFTGFKWWSSTVTVALRTWYGPGGTGAQWYCSCPVAVEGQVVIDPVTRPVPSSREYMEAF